ncbi:hypothetical protein N7535_001668 [Penicillium sp. DV-2018c]|nr:hypothetical protein N7535_001668 [Penicillium sp. DV-2018c]
MSLVTIHLFHFFLLLVLKGKVKKVIAISSGAADLDLINDCDIEAALNIVVAKFDVQYKKDGVLFLSNSPGSGATPEELQAFAGFGEKLAKYAPHFKGPIKPEGSVRHLRSTWGKASVEGGFGGAFISHLGNKQWM